MERVTIAARLASQGRFAEAFRHIDAAPAAGRAANACHLLRADVLERLGRYAESRAALALVAPHRDLLAGDQSFGEFIAARLACAAGDSDAGIAHLQRAIGLAKRGRDTTRLCLAQMRLLALLADRSGPESAVTLLADARRHVVKLGDPHITAMLHLTVGEVDGKRGLLASSLRHAELARAALKPAPNPWLEAWAELNTQAVALLRCDYDAARRHGLRGVELAQESGAAHVRRACLGNLGNLSYAIGEFDQALEYIEAATASLPAVGEHGSAALESMARIRFTQGRLAESEALLRRAEQSIKSPADRHRYVHRHSLMTRARVLLRQHRTQDALEAAAEASTAAAGAGDTLLWTLAELLTAEICAAADQPEEAAARLGRVTGVLAEYPPDVYFQYERTLATLFAAADDGEAAQVHLERARRIADGLRSVPAAYELDVIQAGAPHRDPVQAGNGYQAEHVLQECAAALVYADRPELAAASLAAMLAATRTVAAVSAVRTRQDGAREVLFTQTGAEPDPATATDHLIEVAATASHRIDLIVRCGGDYRAVATLNAAAMLVGVLREVERAKRERERSLALWPIEEVSVDTDAVMAGTMAELVTYGRRVAPTNVTVLITGESGTGKDILARAVHRHSRRADQPFVAFNCSAVPRDMLESQLFGHRRGAFTGADRDNPGIIRSAAGGTLFLDEIGELSLDLQPKLLRFLESGEINPLGEPAPLTVDVRIVAATNAVLEQLVQSGRFREDLFYRLNVVRLSIPPLRDRRDEIPALVHHFTRTAAAEFGKGLVRVGEETMERLLLYAWPGNIRQLQNELRRMVALSEPDAVLAPTALSDELRRRRVNVAGVAGDAPARGAGKLGPTVTQLEREMIKAALHSHSGRVDAAAKALGISRKGLYLKRQRLGL